eukprot:10031603-Lingulodinium_polyedra.AAC.1
MGSCGGTTSSLTPSQLMTAMSAAPGRRQMAPFSQVLSKATRAVASSTPGSANGPPRGAAGQAAAA